MATDLKPINGRAEIVDSFYKSSTHIENELKLTSFSGGLGNGTMLQISTFPFDHIQLNKQQVKELIEVLQDFVK